jgi:hypothetical protein
MKLRASIPPRLGARHLAAELRRIVCLTALVPRVRGHFGNTNVSTKRNRQAGHTA